jgi:ethanolamine utilization protein EutA
LPEIDGILFSGGVSEYIYGREQTEFGDLGPQLGQALRKQAEERGFKVLDGGEGIRATVIGASQYTVQLSGETIYVPEQSKLPVRNLRVFLVRTDWNIPVAERAAQAIEQVLNGRDPEVCNSHFALAVSTPPFLGYGAAQELAKGIDVALGSLQPEDRPQILVFEQNVARVIGGILAERWSIPCVDEISLSELDFIDIGELVKDETFVPVIVKSLAFGV